MGRLTRAPTFDLSRPGRSFDATATYRWCYVLGVNVTSPLRAAQILLDAKWPADADLPKQRRASRNAQGVGGRPRQQANQAARKAFEKAVAEAGASGARVDRPAEAGAVSSNWRKRHR